MKSYRIPLLLVSLLITLSLLTSAVWAATPPQDSGPINPPAPQAQVSTGTAPVPISVEGGGGIQSLSGSNVTFAPAAGGQSCYAPGVPQTLCFQSESYTNDYEYVYNNWLKFPADWVVSNVYIQGTPVCDSGSGFGTFGWSFQTASYEVNISHARYQNTADHCVVNYCVDVVSAANSNPASVSWFFNGDGYGSTPHWPCSSDNYTPVGQSTCDEATNPPAAVPTCAPQVILSPETVVTSGCKGESQSHTFSLVNATEVDSTFNLTYTPDFVGLVTGPESITLVSGASTTFDVVLQPNSCLLDGDIHVIIDVTDGTYSDSASITETVYSELFGFQHIATNPVIAMDNVLAAYDNKVWSITGYGATGVSTYDPAANTWTSIASSAAPFSNYARSGCQIGSKVFIYGDAAGGYTGLWSYDMATNIWVAETPGGTAPGHTGIWAPSWVADETNGLCYMTGGATAPGEGDLTTTYVYDAVGNEWLAPLPNFANARDFHAAYLFNRPADGHDLLCVAGGITPASVALDSTQCYDFTTAAWEAENATMGLLPFAWWGMGYTQRSTVSGDQLWLVNGANSAGALHGQNKYYDVTSGIWVDVGPLASGNFYRTAAVTLNNEIYHIGGSPAGFSPSGLSDKYFEVICPACQGPYFTKTAPTDAVMGEVIPYTITIDPYDLFPTTMTDVLPLGVEYVPGSLTVTPDVGTYGYDSTANSITWAFTPTKLGLNGWKPAVVSGPASTAPLTVSSPETSPQTLPQPDAEPKSVLWDQSLSTINQNAYVNQEFNDLPTYSSFLADDFIASSPWTIDTIYVPGDGWNGFTSLLNATALNFLIYADNAGVPAGDPSSVGDLPIWALSVPPTDPQVTLSTGTPGGYLSNVTLQPEAAIHLPPGHYWLVYYPTLPYTGGGQFGRQGSDTTNGYTGQIINPGGGFGIGTSWQDWTVIGTGILLPDIAFRLEGTSSPVQIAFNATIMVEDVTITNTAQLDYMGHPFEASATTIITPLNRVYLPITLK